MVTGIERPNFMMIGMPITGWIMVSTSKTGIPTVLFALSHSFTAGIVTARAVGQAYPRGLAQDRDCEEGRRGAQRLKGPPFRRDVGL